MIWIPALEASVPSCGRNDSLSVQDLTVGWVGQDFSSLQLHEFFMNHFGGMSWHIVILEKGPEKCWWVMGIRCAERHVFVLTAQRTCSHTQCDHMKQTPSARNPQGSTDADHHLLNRPCWTTTPATWPGWSHLAQSMGHFRKTHFLSSLMIWWRNLLSCLFACSWLQKLTFVYACWDLKFWGTDRSCLLLNPSSCKCQMLVLWKGLSWADKCRVLLLGLSSTDGHREITFYLSSEHLLYFMQTPLTCQCLSCRQCGWRISATTSATWPWFQLKVARTRRKLWSWELTVATLSRLPLAWSCLFGWGCRLH